MSQIGGIAIDNLIKSMPALVCTLRYAGGRPELAGAINEAISTGLDQNRGQTDQGLMVGADGAVRYRASDEPTAWKASASRGLAAIVGQVVLLTFTSNNTTHRCRVETRRETLGGVRLNLLAEFAET